MAEKNVVAKDMVVGMAYKLTVDNEVLDEAGELDAIEFLSGHRNIIPGLESQLTGMQVGEEKSVVVEPKDGYGARDEGAVEELGLDEFTNGVVPEAGMELEMKDQQGQIRFARVISVGKKSATLDFNHPLAGKQLNFDVKIVKLREATAEEIAHGHVHGPGHHH